MKHLKAMINIRAILLLQNFRVQCLNYQCVWLIYCVMFFYPRTIKKILKKNSVVEKGINSRMSFKIFSCFVER